MNLPFARVRCLLLPGPEDCTKPLAAWSSLISSSLPGGGTGAPPGEHVPQRLFPTNTVMLSITKLNMNPKE